MSLDKKMAGMYSEVLAINSDYSKSLDFICHGTTPDGVYITEMYSNNILFKIKGRPVHIKAGDFHPNNECFALGDIRDSIKIYSMNDGTEITNGFIYQSGAVEKVKFSPSGENILATSSGDKKIQVWNIDTLSHNSFEHHHPYYKRSCLSDIFFDKSRQLMLSVGINGSCHVWKYAE